MKTTQILLVLISMLSVLQILPAAADGLIPMEKFFDNPQVDNCQISPDGQWISCLKPHRSKLNVSIQNIDTGEERMITEETERPVLNYFWSADSKSILYLWDHLGDENYHLIAIPLNRQAEQKRRDLTPFEGVTVEVIWIPAKTSNVLITMNKRNPELMDPYWLNIQNGNLRMPAENPGNFTAYLADLSHQVRVAFGINSSGETEVHTRSTEKNPWQLVKKYSTQDIASPLAFHPDGKRIYLKSSLESNFAGLHLLDLSNGEETIVHQDPDAESDLVNAFFDPESHSLLVTLYEGDKVRAYGATPEMQRDLQRIRNASSDNVDLGSFSENQKRWVITFYSPSNPGQAFLYDRKTEKLKLMAESRPWLKSGDLSEAKPISYLSKDGLTIKGYLTLPRGRKPQNLPMILLVHGGPWERDRWSYDSVTQFFANRGYAVLQINYRGSTGLGKKFAFAAKKEFARGMHQDLIDGVNRVVKDGIVDPKRVAIAGISYGGYATLVGLTFTPDTFACGIDFAGPSSLVTLVESFPPSWKPYLGRRWYPMVGNPSDPNDRKDMQERSPLYFSDRIKAPLMIYQGVNDPRVTRVQADQIAVAARKNGVPVHYLLAMDEGHGIDNPENALAVFRAAEKFLQNCLKGEAQDTVDKKIEDQIREMTVDVSKLNPAASDFPQF